MYIDAKLKNVESREMITLKSKLLGGNQQLVHYESVRGFFIIPIGGRENHYWTRRKEKYLQLKYQKSVTSTHQ